MDNCYIVFYSCDGSDEDIRQCHVFPDIECAKRDIKSFYESSPSGLATSIPFSVLNESVYKKIDHYMEILNENI